MNAESKMGEIQTKNRLNPERQSEARTARALDRWDRVRQRAQNIINHLDAAIDQHEVLNAS